MKCVILKKKKNRKPKVNQKLVQIKPPTRARAQECDSGHTQRDRRHHMVTAVSSQTAGVLGANLEHCFCDSWSSFPRTLVAFCQASLLSFCLGLFVSLSPLRSPWLYCCRGLLFICSCFWLLPVCLEFCYAVVSILGVFLPLFFFPSHCSFYHLSSEVLFSKLTRFPVSSRSVLVQFVSSLELFSPACCLCAFWFLCIASAFLPSSSYWRWAAGPSSLVLFSATQGGGLWVSESRRGSTGQREAFDWRLGF